MTAFVLLLLLTGGANPVVHEVGKYSSLDKCKAARNNAIVEPRRDEKYPPIVFVCIAAGDAD
jgi:hypothetical protein